MALVGVLIVLLYPRGGDASQREHAAEVDELVEGSDESPSLTPLSTEAI